MTAKLIVTRGLPGSGKTTWARSHVAFDPATRIRINRDDMRAMTYGSRVLDHRGEEAMTALQHASVRAALAAGYEVVVDDTNFRRRNLREWAGVATSCAAQIEIRDFDVPLEECLRRDAARERPVGEDVIRGMYRRYVAAGHAWDPLPANEFIRELHDKGGQINNGPYEPDMALPPAWIFDMDGTLAIRDEGPNGRGPFEWARVGEDTPNPAVVIVLQELCADARVLVLSGREDTCMLETLDWMAENDIPADGLFMRKAGDGRRDAIVKNEIFWQDIAPSYNVLGVFDDRNSVVQMWRSMGLTCFQVQEGNF